MHFTVRPGGTFFLDEFREVSGGNEISIDMKGGRNNLCAGVSFLGPLSRPMVNSPAGIMTIPANFPP